MESTAKARFVRISPRKVRLVMDMVRGKPVEEALQTLGLVRKSAAPVIAKIIKSALANAENNHEMSTEGLVIKRAFVDEGPTMRRFMPRAMGRATAIRKRTSHITVVLSEK
ncbi:MAG: 50S ribosomal protein L22 [Pseudomonadota bacterium]|jgi:large subunit ribosomal protein L22